MKIILKLLQAHLRELKRNKEALFWAVAFPLLFIVIFGLIFGNDNIPPQHIGLVVEDESLLSEEFVKAFEGITIVNAELGTREALLPRLQEGDLIGVVILEDGFAEASLKAEAKLLLYYDKADRTTSTVILTVVQGIVDRVNQTMAPFKPPIVVSPKELSTQHLRQIDWLVPGILGMAIMQLGLFAAAALVTLREKKVFRRFAVTPIRRHHLVISQVLYRLVFGILQTAALLTFAYLIYDVHVVGNLGLLAGVIMLSVMVFLALGYIIASLSKNEEVVQPIVQVFAMPMMFFSGVFFSIQLMPEFVRPLVNLLPLTYLNHALRLIINNGGEFAAIETDVLVLFAWLVGSMLVAVKVFRWE